MNTFERHFQKFNSFVERIMALKPDYLVPVAKKGCKLLKSAEIFASIPNDRVRYRSFFEYEQVPLKGKRIAVLDDATQYTASLKEHRNFFEHQGAVVTTHSFVGHETLFTGEHEKYDEEADIAVYLREPVYQEYILQQSYHLLRSGQHFDLDHLVFAVPATGEVVERLTQLIEHLGYILRPDDSALGAAVQRFTIDNPSFFSTVPFLNDPGIDMGPIRKIKFAYEAHDGVLLFSPLVFPTWSFTSAAYGSNTFAHVPFDLPFAVPTAVDNKNQSALRRTYYNIYTAYTVALAKAFLQELPGEWALPAQLSLRKNDLTAMLGEARTERMRKAILGYVTEKARTSFEGSRIEPAPPATPRYRDLGALIDELKIGYEQLVRKRGTRLGVHRVVPYDELFADFPDRDVLSEGLDFYCDLGALVPQTIIDSSRITRGCRTGEPKTDFSWDRTRALIPFAIHHFAEHTDAAEPIIAPMTLNKLLANFSYDYPHEHYNELHCFLGVPHTFGTLMHVHHHLRAPGKPTIYDHRKISTNYAYNKKRKSFIARNRSDVITLMTERFDEEQEVPYTTIHTYFEFLAQVYDLFGKRVDVLNLLSVCREPNYFYTHVCYNARMALDGVNEYELSLHDVPNLNGVHVAGTEATSGIEKVSLFHRTDEVIKKISDHFANNMRFIKVLQRIKRNYFLPDAAFLTLLEKVEDLLYLERITANYALLVENGTNPEGEKKRVKYRRILKQHMQRRPTLAPNINIAVPPARDSAEYAEQLEQLIDAISLRVESLPAEEKLLATRLTADELRRAQNKLTRIVYDEKYAQIALLFIDLSGLREIPEPKEKVVAEFYRIVNKTFTSRGGKNLYGGKGGDDAYTILFRDVNPAIECARDIKREFITNLFLGKLDVKFGISFTIFAGAQKELEAILTWGEAKDCCEFKSPTFRNRGDLLVSARTLRNLGQKGETALAGQFEALPGEHLKGTEEGELYKLRALP